MKSFEDVKPGDVVTRLLAGQIPMKLTVSEVTDERIITGGGWEFDRKTGVEEDAYLGWGVSFGVTGSYLVREQ